MPYQPMRKAKDVSQDRMQEILQKNAKTWPTLPKENAPATQPPRPNGKLAWADREPGSMGRYTVCHWYSCCQIGQGADATFEVWTRQPLTSGMHPLKMGLKTWKEAQALAQADSDEHFARGDR